MIPDLARAALDVLRPLPRLSVSDFAAEYRYLKAGTTGQPGKWSNEVFPYLVPVMDAVQEAVDEGKVGVVLMKSVQGGGSEAMENALHWLQVYYGGPALYLISKDDLASEFGRDRFSYANETCEPLKKKHLAGRTAGELIQTKRYVDGKLVIAGGRSVLNLQSTPYRWAFVDEYDSFLEQLQGSDPLKLVQTRTDAYAEFGSTLTIAFAHPSLKERGVGKVYYELSDQRRGFVPCPHCTAWFWLQWEHVKVLPREGQTAREAERDATCYQYVTPCCGAELTDAQRASSVRRVQQRSILSHEEAKKRRWIGLHFSQLYMPAKTIRWLAQEWIEALDSPSVRRVFKNKRLGDVDDSAEVKLTADAWAKLVVEKDARDTYSLGHLPPNFTGWLTSGQDSGIHELHWTVWGWALTRTDAGNALLCGWLVDCGVAAGPAAVSPGRTTLGAEDLHVFDQVLYNRYWLDEKGERQAAVTMGLHDSGWQPVAAYEYAQRQRERAFPSKGLPTDDRSAAAPFTWGPSPRWKVGQEEVSDPALKLALMNTYLLKLDFTAFPEKKFKDAGGVPRARLVLPQGTPGEIFDHLSSEKVILEKGRRKWKATGPNHFFDCAIMAYGAAINLAPFFAEPAKRDSWAPAEFIAAPTELERDLRKIRTDYGGGPRR